MIYFVFVSQSINKQQQTISRTSKEMSSSPSLSPSSPSLRMCKYSSVHSRPQSPRSFWPVAGIESSGLVQHRKSAIHGLPVKFGKSDWLRIRNEYSAYTQKIGSSQLVWPQARDSRTSRQIWQIGLVENTKQILCAYSENRVRPARLATGPGHRPEGSWALGMRMSNVCLTNIPFFYRQAL